MIKYYSHIFLVLEKCGFLSKELKTTNEQSLRQTDTLDAIRQALQESMIEVDSGVTLDRQVQQLIE